MPGWIAVTIHIGNSASIIDGSLRLAATRGAPHGGSDIQVDANRGESRRDSRVPRMERRLTEVPAARGTDAPADLPALLAGTPISGIQQSLSVWAKLDLNQ